MLSPSFGHDSEPLILNVGLVDAFRHFRRLEGKYQN